MGHSKVRAFPFFFKLHCSLLTPKKVTEKQPAPAATETSTVSTATDAEDDQNARCVFVILSPHFFGSQPNGSDGVRPFFFCCLSKKSPFFPKHQDPQPRRRARQVRPAVKLKRKFFFLCPPTQAPAWSASTP